MRTAPYWTVRYSAKNAKVKKESGNTHRDLAYTAPETGARSCNWQKNPVYPLCFSLTSLWTSVT